MTATITDPVLDRVNEDFERGDRGPALREVARYRGEPFHAEPERVALAVLELAGGDLDLLRHHVTAAIADPRDVLLWAEEVRRAAAER